MNDITKAYDFAEKEIKKEKEEALKIKVKEIVKSTLEAIDEIDKEEKELAEKKKILKKDIDDLKAGRLDLIEERQKESEVAKKTSKFHVILQEIHYPPQYCNYTITTSPAYYCGGTTLTCGTATTAQSNLYLTGYQASNSVSGTYNINGIIKYL